MTTTSSAMRAHYKRATGLNKDYYFCEQCDRNGRRPFATWVVRDSCVNTVPVDRWYLCAVHGPSAFKVTADHNI